MQLTTSPAAFSELLAGARLAGRTVGLVPTMGALHAGHLSLMAAARRECGLVAATIFVNPLQFGEAADLAAYPREPEADAAAAEAAGVDVLLAPSFEEMFPEGPPATTVEVAPLAAILEGASRPGHFAGVATIVTKLLALSGSCAAYFGEKDYQQLVIVRRLVADLSLPTRVVGCPVVRDPDGLALSSRNRRLPPAARAAAPALHRALRAGQQMVAEGECDPAAVEALMSGILAVEPLVEPDYAVARDAATLAPLRSLEGDVRLLVAARIAGVRLIDNAPAGPTSPPPAPPPGAPARQRARPGL